MILTSEFCKDRALKETQVTFFVLQLRIGQEPVVIQQLGILTEKKANVSLRCKTEIFNRSLLLLLSSLFSDYVFFLIFSVFIHPLSSIQLFSVL
jgi:hypothetical protein